MARLRAPRRRRLACLSAPVLLVVLVVLLLATPAAASLGDRSDEFARCVSSRYADVCGPDGVDDGRTGRTKHPRRLPFFLRITAWTCEEDCEYHCMHQITNEAEARVSNIRAQVRHRLALLGGGDAHLPGRGPADALAKAREDEMVAATLATLAPIHKEMVQYHGKWVFVRLWGAQEPLSVLFSLGNWAAHLYGLNKVWTEVPDAFPLKPLYLAHALVNMNAWTWSAVFHTRDKPWTEKLDYFSAGAAVLHLFFLTVVRVMRWSSRPATSIPSMDEVEGRGRRRYYQLALGCLVAYICHVSYLSVGRFDYQYNMTANVVVALAQLFTLLAYAIRPSLYPGGWQPGVHTPTLASPPVLHTEPGEFELRPAPSQVLASVFEPNERPWVQRRQLSFPLHGSDDSSNKNDSLVPPAWPSYPETKPLYQRRRLLYLLAVAMIAAGSLELFDFPALWRALDAHALWHAATIPIAVLWYIFLVDDARALTLKVGGVDPLVRPMTPDPSRDSTLLPPLASRGDDDAPWLATDVWGSYAGHRLANPPWWTCPPSARWRDESISLAHSCHLHVATATRSLHAHAAYLRQHGLAASIVAGVDAVADRLECVWDVLVAMRRPQEHAHSR